MTTTVTTMARCVVGKWKRTTGHKTGLVGGHLGVLLVVEPLEKKIALGRKKGVQWLLRSDYPNGMKILGVKTAKHIIKSPGWSHGLPDGTEGIYE